MVNVDLVARKLARTRRWLADAEARFELPPDDFRANVEARDLATFYLFLAMQKTIDLAAHWVADAGWDAPDDAGGAFDALAARGAIGHDLAGQLRAIVGVRSRIAHGYATLDHDRLHEEAAAGILTMRAFLVLMANEAKLPA